MPFVRTSGRIDSPIRSHPRALEPYRHRNSLRRTPGIADVLMTVFGKHPRRTTAGALVGLLVSLPDALGLNPYVGILGTGLLFGALTGWVTKNLGC